MTGLEPLARSSPMNGAHGRPGAVRRDAARFSGLGAQRPGPVVYGGPPNATPFASLQGVPHGREVFKVNAWFTRLAGPAAVAAAATAALMALYVYKNGRHPSALVCCGANRAGTYP